MSNLRYIFYPFLVVGSFLIGSHCDAADLPYLFFYGRVLDDLGKPIKGAQVQFWHTDYNGNYDHPGNPYNGYDLVTDFQYFGTATSDGGGKFNFTTFRPGIYPQRPISHIHYKVWHKGREFLTSQFYFADERPNFDPMLIVDLNYLPDGNTYIEKTIVVDMGQGGTFKRTPPQTEGPFYPVIDFFEVGSDLTAGIGEFGTIYPSWGASGTWSPTGVTELPSTFPPTGVSTAAASDIGTTNGTDVELSTPSPTPPQNSTVTASPINSTTAPQPTTSPSDETNVTTAPLPPTNATNATGAPTHSPPPPSNSTNATASSTPPVEFTNATTSPQQSVVGNNITAPSSAPSGNMTIAASNVTNATVMTFPANSPTALDLNDPALEDPPMKERTELTRKRTFIRRPR